MSELRVVVAGHVDHGKSTLLGRLLMECGAAAPALVEKARTASARQGRDLEPAFLLDAFEEEQAQGVTIETTRVRLEHAGRRFLLIDAPGHLEFLKNMATGASEAELGLLVVDGTEGPKEQTVRHLRMMAFLGLTRVVVAVNKMDLLDWDPVRFADVAGRTDAAARAEGLLPAGSVPVASLTGENLVSKSPQAAWNEGGPLLERLAAAADSPREVPDARMAPLRFPLQAVYRHGEERFYAGRVLSGELREGDELLFSPSGRIVRVRGLHRHPARVASASRGESVALTLAEDAFLERGELATRPGQPPRIETRLRARLAWLSAEPFDPAVRFLLKLGTAETPCRVETASPEAVANGGFVEAELACERPVAFDDTAGKDALNRFVLCTPGGTVAAGLARPRAEARPAGPRRDVRPETGFVSREEREAGCHKGAVLWLTGLPGSGKTVLARTLERALHARGLKAVALDADNLRGGLCADLGFSPEDRAENIRRIAHAAKLFLDAGHVAVVACVSPYSEDRERARDIVGPADFLEVHLSCPLDVCRGRDPKGLYAKAEAGALQQMTGVSAPYQPPAAPALRLDSSRLTLEQECRALLGLLRIAGEENAC